jgi:predicted Zn-dependent protease
MFEDEIIDAIAVEVGSDFGKIDRHLIRQASPGADDDSSLHSALLKTKAYESSCTEEAYEEAAAALRRVLEKSPASATAHAMLGVLLLVGHCEYFRRKNQYPSEAPDHLVLALAAEPQNPYARYGRVVDLLVRREYGELAAVTDEILAEEDFPPGLALLVCFCRLYARNATPKIRARGARLIRQNPEYPRIIHTAWALEHLLSGDPESARRDMAVAELPGNWFGPVVQMAIHHAAGRRSEAKAARKKLIELCPDYDRYGEEVLGRSLHPDFVRLLMAAYRAAA